jgi:hypothetical protein
MLIGGAGLLIILGVALADRVNQRQLEQARLDLGARQVEDTAQRLASWDLDDVDRCWNDRERAA